jgi:hypothetical protein
MAKGLNHPSLQEFLGRVGRRTGSTEAAGTVEEMNKCICPKCSDRWKLVRFEVLGIGEGYDTNGTESVQVAEEGAEVPLHSPPNRDFLRRIEKALWNTSGLEQAETTNKV